MPDLIKLKDKRLPFHLFLSQFLEHNSEEKVKLTVKDKLGIDVDYEVDLKEFIDTKQTAIDSDLDSHKHVSAIAKQNGEDGKAVATFFEFPLILTSLVLAIVFPTPLVFVALTAMILLADVAKVLYDQTNSYSRHVSRMEKAISEAKKGNINRYTKGRVGSFIPLYTKFTYYCASTTDLFGFLFRNRDKRTTLTWNDSGGFQVNSKEESRVRFPKFITKKNFEKLYNKACYEGLETVSYTHLTLPTIA